MERISTAAMDEAIARALQLGEVGLQVAVYHRGRLLVDTWAGKADAARGSAVTAETLFPIFSVTKSFTAVACHIQVERGLIDYDAPIARYWPEFAANGKEGITVRHVLSHRSGVPQMPPGVTVETMCDWDWMIRHIEQMEPLFPANSQSSYQAFIFGWYIGEIVRRTDPTRRPINQFIAEEICTPLGIANFHLGLDPALEPRVATLTNVAHGGQASAGDSGAVSLTTAVAPSHARAGDDVAPYLSLAVPSAVATGPANFNRPDVHAAVLPGAGGIADARSVARLYAMLACGGELDGVRILSRATVESLTQLRTDPYQTDRVVGRVAILGQGGFWLGSDHPGVEAAIGTAPSILCHPGAGGSIGWGDTAIGLAVAICHNRMFSRIEDRTQQPWIAIGDAARAMAADRGALA